MMLTIETIFFLDSAVIILLVIISYLSKRLGEALKKPSFYKLFHIAAALILTAAVINTVSLSRIVSLPSAVCHIVPMAARCLGGTFSVFACLQYWQWLFPELFKK